MEKGLQPRPLEQLCLDFLRPDPLRPQGFAVPRHQKWVPALLAEEAGRPHYAVCGNHNAFPDGV